MVCEVLISEVIREADFFVYALHDRSKKIESKLLKAQRRVA